MINTIFYFTDHLPFDEYISKIANGEISSQTIVFVDDNKAIYKGGLWFGSTSDPDNTEKIILLIRENSYTLPVSSSLVLGGVKIGDHLSITQDGMLSVNTDTLPTYDDDPVKDRLVAVEGAVENIKDTTVTPLLSDGVKIATIQVGNLSKDIYAPGQITLPEPGSSDDPYSYDDSELRRWLDDLEDEIDAAKTDLLNAIAQLDSDLDTLSSQANTERLRLNNVINSLNTNIENRVNQLFADAEWIQTHFPDTGNGSGGGSVSNFGTLDVEDYLQLIGVWARNGDVTKTQWSSIIQRVDSVELSVSQLQQSGGSGSGGSGPTTEEWLAYVRTYVDNQISGVENGSLYVRSEDIDNIIEWLYSGMKAESSPTRTYSLIISAANNNQLGNTAIAGLWSEINVIENNYVAKTELTTSVNDSLATIIEEAKPGSSFTSIINLIDTNKNNISAINSSITDLDGRIVSESTLLNSVANEIDGTTSQSQIKSKVDSEAKIAAATMLSTIKDSSGNVTAESIALAIADSQSARTTLSAYFGSGGSGSADSNLIETIVNTKLNASVTGGSWSSWVNSISGDAAAISAVSSRVTTLENAGFLAQSDLGTKVENLTSGKTSWAGLATSTSLSSAVSSLEASISSKANDEDVVKKASIIASINASNESNVTINADKINITGTAVFKAINGANSNNTTTIDGSKIQAGTITANQINTTNLTVSASNISGLTNAIQSTSISGDNITTGTINANRIDVTGVINAGSGTIDNLVTTKLTGGSASFKGEVEATSFLAGDRSGLNITTTSDRINFNYGGNARAYFTTDSSGMLLWMKSSTGDWYSVDFSNWTNLSGGGGAYPAYSLTLYKLQDTDGSMSVVNQTKTIYYESALSGARFGHCYTDEYGTILASNSNVGSGWYWASSSKNENILVDYLNSAGASHAYAPSYGNMKLYPISFDSSGIMSCDTTTAIYVDVGDVQTNTVVAGASATINSPAECVRYIVGSASSTTSVSKTSIYLDHGHQRLAGNHISPLQDTHNIYVCNYSNSLGSLGHYTTIDYNSDTRNYNLNNH